MELFKLVGKVAVEGTEEAERDIEGVTEEAEESSNRIVDAFKKIGGIVATAFAIDKIIDFGKATVDAAAAIAAEEAAFSQIMGEYTEEAAGKVAKIADATGIVDSRLTPYMTSMSAKFKGLGYDVDEATDYASRGLNLAADAAAFWDKSLDDSMSHLNSFINGSYEGGEAIGLFANDTQMAQYAVEKGIVSETKEWAALDEARKQATRLEYAENMFKASGAVGQAAKESGAYANVQANLTEAWRQFKGVVGEPILQNFVIPAMAKLGDVVTVASEKVEGLIQWVSENKDEIKLWAGVIASATLSVGTFLLILNWGKIMTAAANASKAVKTAIVALNAAMKANIIGIIVSLIVGLVAAFIWLWNNCDEFRQFWIDLWEKIKTAFAAFVDWISPAIETIKGFFVSLWEKITEIWDSIMQSLQPLIEEITSAFQMAWEVIKLIWDYVQPYFAGVWEAIKAVFTVVKEVLGLFFKNAWEYIKLIWSVAVSYFQMIWENIKAVFSVVAVFLSGFFKTAWEAIKAIWNVVVAYFELVWAGIKAVFAVVKGVLSGNFTDAWNAIKNVWDKVKNYFSTIWTGIKNVFGSVGSWFGDTFKAAWEAVKNVFSNWGSFFSGLWDKIKNTFSNIGTNIANAISSSVKAGLNGVISMIEGTINTGINLINGAINLINKIPNVSISKISKLSLPRLAKGGIVDRATVAEIGEDGAEAVVPLEKNTEWINKLAERINGGANSAAINRIIELLEELRSMKVYLQNDVLVGELIPALDTGLGDINRMRVRGG